MKNPLLLLLSVLTVGSPSIGASQTERVLKQRLDSSIVQLRNIYSNKIEPFSKTIYEYDQNGYQSLIIEIDWDTIKKEWILDYKRLFTHDNNGNITSETAYRWSSNDNAWFGHYKTTSTYYANNLTKVKSDYNFNYATQQLGMYLQTYSEYNADSNLLKHTTTHWNQNTYIFEGKINNTYTYNSNGDLIQHQIYRWNDSLSTWNLQSRYQYLYNSNGQKTMEESVGYSVNDTSIWLANYRNEFTYDSLGGLISQIDFTGHNQINTWYPLKKYDHINDSNQNHLSTITSAYDTTSNTWNFYSKGEFIFNANNLNISTTFYLWNTNYWWEQSMFTHTFNANNKETSRASWQFDHQINSWKGLYKSSRSYYASGVIDTSYDYTWDDLNQTWLNVTMGVVDIDSYNNTIKTSRFRYDTVSNTWALTERVFKNYNTTYPVSSLMIPYSYREAYQLDFRQDSKWNSTTNLWDTSLIQTNYFSSFNLTSVHKITTNSVFIYPNPIQDQFSISGIPAGSSAQLTLYDATGRLVLSTSITSNHSITSSSLNHGMYIYVITNLSRTYTGKIIKN